MNEITPPLLFKIIYSKENERGVLIDDKELMRERGFCEHMRVVEEYLWENSDGTF